MKSIELALKKQRLLIESASLRTEFTHHAAGLVPLLAVADQLQAGTRWVGRHPEIIAMAAAMIVAAGSGPRRFLWRWLRRGFVAWRLWRNRDHWFKAANFLPSP